MFANSVTTSEEFENERVGGVLMTFSDINMFIFWCEFYNLINFYLILSQSACFIKTKGLDISWLCRFLRLISEDITILEPY